ncbi:MAG TPA: preprotein translocase subunit SecG [Pirellulales bacterium]|jgi:preprotein translocase subunit SecG|nr:preprotein translocase subunit SecG [Pirellulales bacterium]
MTTFIGLLMMLTASFMILLILIQRGKGGGLAGAFGGMGGQSAFGTKAGDLFTRVTIGVATFWILLCVFAIVYLGKKKEILPADAKAGVETNDTGNDMVPGAFPANSGKNQAPGAGKTDESTGKPEATPSAPASGESAKAPESKAPESSSTPAEKTPAANK